MMTSKRGDCGWPTAGEKAALGAILLSGEQSFSPLTKPHFPAAIQGRRIMGVPVTVTALFCSYHIQALCRTLDANDPFIFLAALGNDFCFHSHLKLGGSGAKRY